MKICIFCLKHEPDVSFTKRVHLSRALGFERLLTKAAECDECNRFLGDKVELHAFKGELQVYRALLGIRRVNTSGKVVSPPEFKLGNFSTLQSVSGRQISTAFAVRPGKRQKVNLLHDSIKKKVSVSFSVPNHRDKVSRFLSKIVIETYAELFEPSKVLSGIFDSHRANALGKFENPKRNFLPYFQKILPPPHKPIYKIGVLSDSVDGVVLQAGNLLLAMPLTISEFEKPSWDGLKRITPSDLSALRAQLLRTNEL